MLERHNLSDKMAELNKAGAELSKRAAGDFAHVFASMGPCGKMVMTNKAQNLKKPWYYCMSIVSENPWPEPTFTLTPKTIPLTILILVD